MLGELFVKMKVYTTKVKAAKDALLYKVRATGYVKYFLYNFHEPTSEGKMLNGHAIGRHHEVGSYVSTTILFGMKFRTHGVVDEICDYIYDTQGFAL